VLSTLHRDRQIRLHDLRNNYKTTSSITRMTHRGYQPRYYPTHGQVAPQQRFTISNHTDHNYKLKSSSATLQILSDVTAESRMVIGQFYNCFANHAIWFVYPYVEYSTHGTPIVAHRLHHVFHVEKGVFNEYAQKYSQVSGCRLDPLKLWVKWYKILNSDHHHLISHNKSSKLVVE
jgi:hypothetical protein